MDAVEEEIEPMYSTMNEDEEPHLWEEMGRNDEDDARRRSSSVSIEMRSVSFDEEEEQRSKKHVCERITSTVLNAAKGTEDIFKDDSLESRLLLNEGEETEDDDDDDEDTPLCSPASFSPKTSAPTNLNIDTQDLDKLFTQIYDYYREHGFACVLMSRLSELITIGFTIALSTFLSLFVQVTYLISRFMKEVQYTVVLFFVGVAYAMCSRGEGLDNVFVNSIQIWSNINPHLILFIFLPALLFGDSLSMNFHHLKIPNI